MVAQAGRDTKPVQCSSWPLKTYRHDLESFFYVLLRMCARCSCANKFGEGYMTINGLERIMSEFPDNFGAVKPLCLKVRSIMFGDTARLSIGVKMIQIIESISLNHYSSTIGYRR